jgi:hypothetical protein
MARFKRIRSEEDEQRRNQLPTHAQINKRMQDSFSSSVGSGLSDAVAEAVMSGFRVIIAMVALVIVLWFLTTLN